jgi:hypothetical protein
LVNVTFVDWTLLLIFVITEELFFNEEIFTLKMLTQYCSEAISGSN